MDTIRFDRWTRTLSLLMNRRGLVGALGPAVVMLPGLAVARKKRKKKKIKRNDFGCVNVGNFCKSDEQCCSGICQGKKGKKKCKGHDQSTCQAEQDICGGLEVLCITTTAQPGECTRTTGEASYCAGDGDCFSCATDADCLPFCGPGAACIACADCLEIEGVETVCAGLSEGDCTFP